MIVKMKNVNKLTLFWWLITFQFTKFNIWLDIERKIVREETTRELECIFHEKMQLLDEIQKRESPIISNPHVTNIPIITIPIIEDPNMYLSAGATPSAIATSLSGAWKIIFPAALPIEKW